MATRFVYIVTDKDFSILTHCFNCLLQGLDFLCFLCLSPDVVLQGDTTWLASVVADVDDRELAL